MALNSCDGCLWFTCCINKGQPTKRVIKIFLQYFHQSPKMNAFFLPFLLFGLVLTFANFYAIFGLPLDEENMGYELISSSEDDSDQSPMVDIVTQNYVETLVRNEEHLKAMRQFAVEWAHNNALIFRTKEKARSSDVSVIAPFSLFPSPFPRHAFEHALSIQKALNELYFRVGTDFDFLEEAYSDLIKTDDHFRNMMDMLRTVHEEGIKQPITVVYQRADYMLNVVDGQNEEAGLNYEIKQLEVNCGAIVGTNNDRHAAELNQVMLRRAGFHPAPEDLPENWPDRAQIESIKMAWEAYGNPKAIVAIIESPFSQTLDAVFFETELDRISDGQIKVARVDLLGCAMRCSMDQNFALRLDGREVAVVKTRYSLLGFRSTGDIMLKATNVRLMLERSSAIKIPSSFIGFSCSKKVQQLLAEPGQLERFLPNDAEMVKAIRKTFAGMWSLENTDEKTEEKIKDAIEHPENYVLKSNMECGGNNYFDEKITEKLKEIKPEQRPFHILMQKLRPMPIKNIMVHPFTESKIDTMVSELGVYGVLMGNMLTKEVNHNVQQGHLLKTKLASANEGGISMGSAVHDSPILF